MNLIQHIDRLDSLVLKKGAPISEMRGRIASIREYAEAQAKEIANLKKKYVKLLKAHSDLQDEHAKLKEAHEKLKSHAKVIT